MAKRGVAVRSLIGVGLVFFLTACENGFSLFPASEIPAELQFLLDNEADFSLPSGKSAAASPPAPADNDLENVSGCWGTVRAADGDIPVKTYAVYQFDNQTKQLTWSTLQQDPFGLDLFDIVAKECGTYEILKDEDGQYIAFTITEVWVNDPSTGNLVKEEELISPDATPRPLLFSFSDNSLWQDVSDETTEWWWMYNRFDCPE